MKGNRQFYLFIIFLFQIHLFFPFIHTSYAQTASDKGKVLLMEIKSEINPQSNRYVKLALERALEIKAEGVVIEMNTYGGTLNDADEIRTRLLEFPKPIVVFINKNAASAGALISIACDSIYMAPGANIGAATVVTGDGTAAGGKYQSYMRSIMRSTAEANGRNPALAEAMVDADLASDTLNQAGKVLSLTTTEAIKLGYCEKKALNVAEVLKFAGFASYEEVRFELSATEKVISFFMNPFVSGLLILIILGGIYLEFQSPGMIFPIAAAGLALVLYFIPYYLSGLADNWEIILFFIGVMLLAVEIFVIPGFGIAGISGIILMVGSLALAMISNDFFDFSLIQIHEVVVPILIALSGFLGGIILMIVGGWKATGSTHFRNNIALPNVQDSKMGYNSSFRIQSMVGEVGKSYTVLRPSGKIIIGEQIFDAYSRGEYIEKDENIVVISDEGTSLKVKKVEA
ncbi:MAG TPA: NfeD family protein [Cytophagales bacterium]|nr:NfeD family protein [Cytophagales bacterium]